MGRDRTDASAMPSVSAGRLAEPSRLWLLWLVLAALALRVGAVVGVHALPPLALVGSTAVRPATHPVFPDSVEFLMVSWHIRAGDGPILSGDSAVGRMPGYPYLLAGITSVFGEGLLAPRLVQAALGALAVGMAALLAGRLFGRRVALAAGVIAAVYPMFIMMSALLLSETLFILLFLAGILCLHRAFAEDTLPAAIAAGAAFGAATLVRSSLLLYVPMAAGAWVVLRRFKVGAFVRAAMMLAAFAAVMAPWVVRNWRVTGHFVPTRLRVGPSLYEALNPEADGGPMMQRIDWGDGTEGLTEYEKNALWRIRAIEYAKQNPGHVASLAVRKLVRFWNIMPNDPRFRRPLIVIGMGLPFAGVMFLALLGGWLSWGRADVALTALLPVVYYSLLHMVFVSSVRYRVAVMPLLIVLAGLGMVRVRGHVRSRRSPDATSS